MTRSRVSCRIHGRCVFGVNAGTWRKSQRQLSNVAHDADDFNLQWRVAIDRQAPADRVRRPEVGARQGFIDCDHRRGGVHVASIERPTGHERDSKRCEVVQAHHAEFGKRALRV